MKNSLWKSRFSPPAAVDHRLIRKELVPMISLNVKQYVCAIIAAAGYGKTSLMLQVCENLQATSDEIVWLSIEERDNDYRRFVESLVQAVGLRRPNFCTDIVLNLQSQRPASFEVLIKRFCEEVGRLPQTMHLFLDDAHVLLDTRAAASLSLLLQSCPVNLRIYLSARFLNSSVHLSRLRMSGVLVEVCESDLNFSVEECLDFYNRSSVETPGRKLIEAVHRATKGWPAGVCMASHSLENDLACLTQESLSDSSDQSVFSFLANEVLLRQDSLVRDFLLRTSVLRQFNRELSEYVTAISGQRSIFDQSVGSGLFIERLDESGEWYRYHQVFQAFLSAYCDRLFDRSSLLGLHERAAYWYEENGIFMEAVFHCCVIENYERAARILEIQSEKMFSSGEIDVLLSFVGEIPESVLFDCPKLMLFLAWQEALNWDFSRSRYYLSEVERRLIRSEKALCPSSALNVFLRHRKMILALMSDDQEELDRLCAAWTFDDVGCVWGKHLQFSIQTMKEVSNSNRLRSTLSRAKVLAMNDVSENESMDYGNVYHTSLLARILFLRGESQAAVECYSKARQLSVNLEGSLSVLAGMPALMLCEALYYRNDSDACHELINSYLPSCQGFGICDQVSCGYMVASRLARAGGDFRKSLALLDEMQAVARQYGFSRVDTLAVCERILIYVQLSETKLIESEVKNCSTKFGYYELRPSRDSSETNFHKAYAWSKWMASVGAVRVGQRLMRIWYEYLIEQGYFFLSIKAAILSSVLMAASGDWFSAKKYLSLAIKTPQSESFVRLFLDEREALQVIFMKLASDGSCPNEIEKLLWAEFSITADVLRTHTEENFDQSYCHLKNRELEIIVLASKDCTNRQIADQLGLSVNTVKWYWKTIFQKLNVTHRRAALRMARTANLIR